MHSPADFKKVYQFQVKLLEVEPPIWRRILVPESFTLAKLHHVLQIVMGWQDCHLHSFKVGSKEYGMPDPDYEDFDMEMLDEKKVTLKEIVAQCRREFTYEYDPGDSWQHLITVEQALEPSEVMSYPICIAGGRACPPEDCGGTPGYETFLAAIKDEKHPEHEDMKRWVCGHFDPESFDANAVNRGLRNVRWFSPKRKAARDLRAVEPRR